MASVYTNDLRLEEIGSGEQSGTWGDTTNTNLELIAEGLSFGTEGITTNADTHTSTVADGATDPARSMFIKYTGTLDSACTITIAPNTLSRVHFIENGTSGSQNIIIKQGSGATITIPPGDTKVVYLDGAGSGAAVVDAFASLSIGALTQDGGAVFNEASADVDFRVESNGNANMLFVDGGNDAVVIGHNNANDGSVSSAFALQNIGTSYNSSSIGLARFSADVNAPTVAFHKSRNASIGGDTVVADNDELGRIRFFGNDGTDFAEGARITALVNGTPGGGDMPTELVFATSADGAESPTARMAITSAGKIGIGTNSPASLIHGMAGDLFLTANSTSSDSGQGIYFQSTTSGWATSAAHAAIFGKRVDASNGYLKFDTRGSGTTAERMRLTNAGGLLVGTTSDPTASGVGIALQPDASGAFLARRTSTTNNNSAALFYNPNGLVGSIRTSGSATSFNTSSDYRLKTDAQPMTGASDRVLALKPVNFEWIADGTRVDGFLAHEAQAVVPEAVTGTKDAMMDEEYQVSAATGDIYTPATEAYVDADGNDVDAVEEVINSADVEQPETLADGQQWRETTAAVMGTRSVPDMQGIDQSKLVPLLVASLQEALARITALENA